MLKVDFIETGILLEFYYNKIFPIKFPLPKLIFTINVSYLILGLIFLGLG
jgi:hypothetical protein